MPDNVAITAGSGTTIATDQLVGGEHVQLVKLMDATADASTRIAGGGGTEATALRVTLATDSTGLVSVDDNAASLTVDAPVGTPVAARLSDGTAFLTTTGGRLSIDASGVAVPVTDNAGALTVDQATASSLNAQVVGELAHDAVDSGNPQKIGGRASTSQITAVASADRVDAIYDVHGRQMVRGGHQNFSGNKWTAIHVPAENTQATASKASAGAGVRNVCTDLTIVLAAGTTAPSAFNGQMNLIDGATGGTTYLWRATISLPATAGAMNGIALSNLWLPGTAATAMTLEFSGAGGVNTIESVSMSGVTVSE